MRCANCGWMNPDELNKCQKCGQPLVHNNEPIRPQQILRESPSTTMETPESCPNCGYPLVQGTTKCPMCGSDCTAAQQPSAVQHISHVQRSDSDNRPTVIINRDTSSLKATQIADRSPMSSGRETVIADRQSPSQCRETIIADRPVCNSSSNACDGINEVKLLCMDDAEHSTITIVSKKNLTLNPGTVILIGEKRYKVI